jgi:hypothetical protein
MQGFFCANTHLVFTPQSAVYKRFSQSSIETVFSLSFQRFFNKGIDKAGTELNKALQYRSKPVFHRVLKAFCIDIKNAFLST